MKTPAAPDNPILVTGIHRSGTTWVGKMLAACGHLTYISEPLNVHHRPGVFGAPVPYWYTFINSQNEDAYLPAFEHTLRLRYRFFYELRALRSVKDVLRMGRDGTAFLWGCLWHHPPLIKDPFAVFSAPWFAERLRCSVVILVRHPAAVVSSLKRLGWSFDFRDLLNQPLLMETHLAPYQKKMQAQVQKERDVIGEGSLLWCIIYDTIERYQRQHPGFIIIRHEDVSLTPMQSFEKLYTELAIPFNRRAQKTLQRATSPINPKELSAESVHSIHLNSVAAIGRWKEHLTDDEVMRIREVTAGVAEGFYSDADWL
ncbi:MAG: sulfotransferase [Chloroflexota bacterium]